MWRDHLRPQVGGSASVLRAVAPGGQLGTLPCGVRESPVEMHIVINGKIWKHFPGFPAQRSVTGRGLGAVWTWCLDSIELLGTRDRPGFGLGQGVGDVQAPGGGVRGPREVSWREQEPRARPSATSEGLWWDVQGGWRSEAMSEGPAPGVGFSGGSLCGALCRTP